MKPSFLAVVLVATLFKPLPIDAAALLFMDTNDNMCLNAPSSVLTNSVVANERQCALKCVGFASCKLYQYQNDGTRTCTTFRSMTLPDYAASVVSDASKKCRIRVVSWDLVTTYTPTTPGSINSVSWLAQFPIYSNASYVITAGTADPVYTDATVSLYLLCDKTGVNTLSWTTAKSYCQSVNYELAQLSSTTVENGFKTLMQATQPTDTNCQTAYVGATYNSSATSYNWYAESTAMASPPAGGQPATKPYIYYDVGQGKYANVAGTDTRSAFACTQIIVTGAR